MSSDDWFETTYDEFEEEKNSSDKWKHIKWDVGQDRKFGWKFTSDWVGLEFNPCIDLELQLFDVSIFCIYILPWNKLAGFQIFGVGIEWSW